MLVSLLIFVLNFVKIQINFETEQLLTLLHKVDGERSGIVL